MSGEVLADVVEPEAPIIQQEIVNLPVGLPIWLADVYPETKRMISHG
jgi:hypothetical protein